MIVIVRKLEVSTFCSCIRKHIWFSLVGSELDAGANNKEPDICGANSDCSGQIVTAVVVWILGLVPGN